MTTSALMDAISQTASAYTSHAATRLVDLGYSTTDLDDDWIRHQVSLPLDADPTWPDVTEPVKVCDGALHADLTATDRDAFAALLETMPDADAETLATEAQAWRLPVTPYRHMLSRSSDPPSEHIPIETGRDLSDITVVDLTSLWAGPLATALLGRFGATVVKIEASVRPDGFRSRPALYAELNEGKQILDLDLTTVDDRATFEDLVARADLVISSFSRRVMPNLGYDAAALRRINPQIATLSITAFPAHTVERDWIAYGSGIHAVSGLGMLSGTPQRPRVAYPDPLTGLRAFGVALGLVAKRSRTTHHEVSLLGSIAPVISGMRR